MAGSTIKSVLKESVKNLPDNFSMKSKSVLPFLEKKGVKKEELKWAEFRLPEGKDKVNKQDLVDAESNRRDEYVTVDGDGDYRDYNLQRGKISPTYREKIYTFSSVKPIKNDLLDMSQIHTIEVEYDKHMMGESNPLLVEELTALGLDAGKPKEIKDFLKKKATQSRMILDLRKYKELSGKRLSQLSPLEKDLYRRVNREFGLLEIDEVDQTIEKLINEPIRINETRYKSGHFAQIPNYLSHTRTFDEVRNGTKIRNLIEIQSDLHQSKSQKLREIDDLFKEVVEIADNNFIDTEGKSLNEIAEDADDLYSQGEIPEDVYLKINNKVELEMELFEEMNKIPDSPQSKDWLKKSIERELVDAQNEGIQALAIPISGPGVKSLVRSEGPQKWYETQVLNTVKNLAKKNKLEYRDRSNSKKIELDKSTLESLADSEQSTNSIKLARQITNEHKHLAYHETSVYSSLLKIDNDETIDTVEKAHVAVNTALRDRYATIYLDRVKKPRADVESELAKVKARREELKNKMLEETDVEPSEFEQGYNMEAVMALKGNQDHVDVGREYSALRKDEVELEKTLAEEGDEIVTDRTKPLSFNLYSSPAAGGFAVYQAYQMGASEEQVRQELIAKGKSEEEADKLIKAANAIQLAKSKGGSDEDIKSYIDQKYEAPNSIKQMPEELTSQAMSRWATGDGLSPRAKALNSLMSEEAENARDLLSSMKTIKPTLTSNIFTDITAFLGNKEAQIRYDRARLSSRKQIQDMFKAKYGIDVAWEGNGVGDETWKFLNKQGEVEEITPTFWQDLAAETGEIVGGTAGFYLGFKLAPASAPVVGPLSKPLSGIVAGIGGAVIGSELDYMRSAFELQEDLEAEVAAYTALNAAEIAVIGEAVGYGVIKGLGVGWKGIIRAKDMLFDGNTKGAYEALKEATSLSDSEIDEIIAGLERYSNVPGNSREEKAIAAVSITDSGLEDLVGAAGKINTVAPKRVYDAIDKRAKSVLEAAEDISTPNAAVRFVKDLANYKSDVRQTYRDVKQKAVTSANFNNFSFDYDSLAIDPVLDRLFSKIADPTVKERFVNQAARVRDLAKSRSFGDLLELRQMTNDFLYNKRITKYDDQKALRSVINEIDKTIKLGANKVLDEPEKWLEEWNQAKLSYSKMKQLEKSAMFRLVFDKDGNVKPVTPESVTKAMTKYLTTLDGNFDELLERLPKNARKVYEGAAIDTLVNKFTIGYKGEKQAVHFGPLAEELNKLKFTSDEARVTKDAILAMSEVFKNDMPLALTNSSFRVPKFQSYLTADPVVRAKFELASSTFNYIKTLSSNREQRNNALIRKVAKLLEDPLDPVGAKEVIDSMRQSPEMLKSIAKMQREVAYARAKGLDHTAVRVNVFRGGSLKGQGEPIAKVPKHRIASVEEVASVADQERMLITNKSLDMILKRHGYLAVEDGSDRVRLLK